MNDEGDLCIFIHIFIRHLECDIQVNFPSRKNKKSTYEELFKTLKRLSFEKED